MGSIFQIKSLVLEDGGRRHILINRADGLPLVAPTYYITSMVYLIGNQTNTQRTVLSSIQFLYEWSGRRQIDLEARFKQGLFLKAHEISRLCDDITVDFGFFTEEFDFAPRRQKPRLRRHRMKFLKPVRHINQAETTCIKLTYAKKYLDWLAFETISRVSLENPKRAQLEACRAEMIGLINARIPESSEKPLRKGLDPEGRARLLEVIKHDHKDNPFKSKFIRKRNELFIRMLDHLGIRRSEALLIKIDGGNLDYNNGTINIREYPNDPTDTRNPRPQFKTDERPLTLGEELCKLLRDYILRYRSKLKKARSHGYLFVSDEGDPLSLSAADDICLILRGVPGVPGNLANHLLRYTWNDRFSQFAADKVKKGEWSISDEEVLRRIHQGWKEGSEMPAKYSRRYNEEKANEVGKKLQTDLYYVVDET